MAREAAEMYGSVHLDLCFSSPLRRAIETAEILLGERGFIPGEQDGTGAELLRDGRVPILTDDRLREMAFGEYEGIIGYLEGAGTPIDALFLRPQDYRESAGGAETFPELFARTGAFLRERVYPRLQEGRDVLILGHGAMNSAIVCQVKSRPIEQFWKSGLAQCRMMKLI